MRRWVPELVDVPAKHVHAPWEMDDDEAAAAGMRWNDTYPRPIVDLKERRERALAAFREATDRRG